MNSKYLDLNYILNLEEFQKLQDDISKVVGFGLITVDYRGKPVTIHSRCSKFCKKLRENPTKRKYCEKSDSRGGLEAARLRKPYIYLCHMGLVDFAVPIIVEDNYLGAVLAGQIVIDKEEDKNKLERVFYNPEYEEILKNDEELRTLYEERPKFSLKRIETVANLILHFTSYLVEEAIVKASCEDSNLRMSRFLKFNSIDNLRNEENEVAQIDKDLIKLESNNAAAGKKKNFIDARKIKYYQENYNGNPILKPAVNYMRQNPRRKIYIDEMAELCNISVSYFSRLFKKELNETFSKYVNKVKIMESKELLEITKLQISEIAFNLGYEDCGYFIKIFKKYIGKTPAIYRKEYLQNESNQVGGYEGDALYEIEV